MVLPSFYYYDFFFLFSFFIKAIVRELCQRLFSSVFRFCKIKGYCS